MWDRIKPLMSPYESIEGMSGMLVHIRQLIGELEKHRAHGGNVERNAAIDALITIFESEKFRFEQQN